MLLDYGSNRRQLITIKSRYCQPEVCVCVNGNKKKNHFVIFVKDVFCHSPFRNLRELAGHAQPN